MISPEVSFVRGLLYFLHSYDRIGISIIIIIFFLRSATEAASVTSAVSSSVDDGLHGASKHLTRFNLTTLRR